MSRSRMKIKLRVHLPLLLDVLPLFDIKDRKRDAQDACILQHLRQQA